jgi:hypothetical protein
LEAFLDDTPMGSTTSKKNAATNSVDEPTTKIGFVDDEELGAFRLLNSVHIGNNTSAASNHPMGHLSSRQSMRHPPASSRNHAGLSVPTLRDNLPKSMPSSLMDSTSRNHNSILEKSRKMAAQSKSERTTRMLSEGRPNRTLLTIGRRYVINEKFKLRSLLCCKRH